MSTPFEHLVDGIARIIVTGLFAIGVIIMIMYWLVWNNAKMTLGKAMDEIEDRMDKVGYIEENYVRKTLNQYCDSEAFNGYSFSVVEPGFNIESQYIGQPLYVEVVLDCSVVGIDFTVKGKADAYNRGRYGSGYNTPNQH